MKSGPSRPPQAKRQQRKLNFLITQTELYAHFMGGKASTAGPGGEMSQEDILKKLEDSAAHRQIDIGGGVMVNMGQEDYGGNSLYNEYLVVYQAIDMNIFFKTYLRLFCSATEM